MTREGSSPASSPSLIFLIPVGQWEGLMCQLLPGVAGISLQHIIHCARVSRVLQRDDSTCPQRVICCLPSLLAADGNRNSPCTLGTVCQPVGTGQGMHGVVTKAIARWLGPAARCTFLKSFSVLLGGRLCPLHHGDTVLPVPGQPVTNEGAPCKRPQTPDTSPVPPLLTCQLK